MDREETPRLAMPDPATVPRPWLGSYPPGVPTSYPYPDVPLTRLLDDAARDFPRSTALSFSGATTTYRELLDQVDSLAAGLRGLGLGYGDRVAILLPNCPQHVVALFAVLRVGAVVVEHDPGSAVEVLAHQFADARCAAVVFLDALWPVVQQLRGRLPAVAHWIGTGLHEAQPPLTRAAARIRGHRDGTYRRVPRGAGTLRFRDLAGRAPGATEQAPLAPTRDPAAILYPDTRASVPASGRGIVLTHANLVANAFQARLWVPDVQAGREVLLCVVPFSDAYGLTTCVGAGVLSAATLHLVPAWDRDRLLRSIDRRRPTLFPGAPAMYVELTSAPDVERYDLRSIRACVSGGGPLPPEVVRRFEELTGGKLREGYGLPECSPLTHGNPVYGKAKVGTVGLPVPDTVAVLVDPEDATRQVAPGEAGALLVAGPQVMQGYWNRPAETAAVLRDGWLRTGDRARLDDDGYLVIVGRAAEGAGAAGP